MALGTQIRSHWSASMFRMLLFLNQTSKEASRWNYRSIHQS